VFKKIILFLMIFLLFCNSVSASNEICNILNKQLEIEKFQVDVELEITAFADRNLKFMFTYFFQEPDQVHLETQDFVLLPEKVIKTLQPDFFHLARYNYRYIESKERFRLYELRPKNSQESYRIILWLDLEDSLIKRADMFFQIEDYKEEFVVQIDYEQIEGYSLPVYIKGNLPVPTKFGIGGVIKESKKGSFILKLNNYRIEDILVDY